jgi:hypothetical protein
MMKSIKSMKKMVLTAAAVMVMMSFAAPAMAEQGQDQRGDAPPVNKDPGGGIISTDPVDDPSHHPAVKDPGIRLCDITPTDCHNTDDSKNDKNNEHNDEDEYPEYCKDVVYDPTACDKNNEHSQNTDDSQNDQGHNSGARPDAKDLNPGKKEESKEEEKEASAPGAVQEEDGKVAERIIAADKEKNPALEADIASGSPVIHGCPFDYVYDYGLATCLPSSDLMSTIEGEVPWPDSAGGYVGLIGGVPGDLFVGSGFGVDLLVGGLGDTLVWFGEGGGPIGYGIQGLGYAVGFAGEMAGAALQTAGEIVGGAADIVGGVVDGIGDAAGAILDLF